MFDADLIADTVTGIVFLDYMEEVQKFIYISCVDRIKLKLVSILPTIVNSLNMCQNNINNNNDDDDDDDDNDDDNDDDHNNNNSTLFMELFPSLPSSANL